MRDLSMRSLRIFEAVASAGSFSKGADALDLTQSAVSQQMRSLEQEVGHKLFDTHSRPIQLTDAGRELLRHARVILTQVSVAMDAIASMEGQYKGQLHIGAVVPSNYFVPKIVAAFLQEFPEVRIKLTVDNRDALLTMLAEHRLDYVFGGYPPAEAEVEAETFARHPHCLVAHSSHPLLDRKDLKWDDLQKEPFILREPGSATRRFFEHLLQTQRLQVNINFELHGNEAVKHAVIAGLGISFLSAHVFQPELQLKQIGVLDVIDMPKWLDWCILNRREPQESVTKQTFKRYVLEHGSKYAHCELGR